MLRAMAINIPSDQDARRRPQEDLDVEPERLEQEREVLAQSRAVEEQLLHALPAGGERDEDHECADDDRRADGGDRRAAPAHPPLVELAPARARA